MIPTINDYESKQAARDFTAQQLRQAFPYLIPANTGSSGVIAAKNIRIELKRAFPKIKFSVRYKSFSGGNSIDVGWTDGPASDQVKAITGKYESGSFDGMTDSYHYSNQHGWHDSFGDAKYISEIRHYSDAALINVMGRICRKFDVACPTVADYRQGNTYRYNAENGCDVGVEIYRALGKHTFCLDQSGVAG